MEDVRQGLWQRLMAGDRAEKWELENGNFFLRGLTMAKYIQIIGSSLRMTKDNKVKWQHILPIDGATNRKEGTTIIEVRGVPLGCRSWLALGGMVRPFGSLRRILSEGIMTADPNIVLLEVAGLAGGPPPLATRISGSKGIFKVRMVPCPPPPPPQLIYPQSCMEVMERRGGDTGQARLKGMTVEEAGSMQIAHEGEMSRIDRSHTKLDRR